MRRLVILHCTPCNISTEAMCEEDEEYCCATCGSPCEQQWWARSPRDRTQADEKDSVVVFRKPDGTYAYPAVNTKPTPEGCERIVLRTAAEVERHEREAGVRNESLWFNSGNGCDGDSTMRPVAPRMDPELVRLMRDGRI